MSPEHGSLLADESFGNKRVRIYSQGYVQVSGLIFGAKSAPFEKLSAIEDSSDVQKKSALGRTAGAALTMGLNVALSSNKRGDVYLAIVTSTKTHMLHDDPPTERGLKAAKKLAAAGRAALAQAGRDDMPLKTSSTSSIVSPTQPEATPATPGPRLIVRTQRQTYSLQERNRTAAGERAVERLLEVWADVGDGPTAKSTERRLSLSTVLDGKRVLLYSSGHITIRDRLVHGSDEPKLEKVVSLAVAVDEGEDAELIEQADPPRANNDAGSPSTAERLRELGSLLAENLISEEEFAQLRARVLGNF